MTQEELNRLYPEAAAEMLKPLHLRDGRKLPPITAQIHEVQPKPFDGGK